MGPDRASRRGGMLSVMGGNARRLRIENLILCRSFRVESDGTLTIEGFAPLPLELRQRMEGEAVEERLVEFLIELENEAFLTLDPPAIAAGFRTSTGPRMSNLSCSRSSPKPQR